MTKYITENGFNLAWGHRGDIGPFLAHMEYPKHEKALVAHDGVEGRQPIEACGLKGR